MVLVCHVILEDHVIKVLKPPLLFSLKHMAYSMSYSHIRNFTINVALTKTFTCVFSASSLILVTPFCITNNEIYAKKTFVDPSKNDDRKQKERKKKQQQGFLPYMQTQKVHIEINNILAIMSKCLGNLFRGLLEITKCQIIGFFPGYQPQWRQPLSHFHDQYYIPSFNGDLSSS